MKKLLAEFKEFISRGNVMDMAIGVIMATAFSAITNTLINSVLMPFISWVIGARDMSALNWTIRAAQMDEAGQVVREAITLGFGDLVSAVINFLVISLVVFAIVKATNVFHRKKEEPAPPPQPSAEEALLREIRDLLKEKQ